MPMSHGLSVKLQRSRLPVLLRTDVIVVGGSMAGVAAALGFARAGHKVVLIEHRTYLGREISATLKPWIDLGRLINEELVPDPIGACLRKMSVTPRTGEIPLWLDAFKRSLEDELFKVNGDLIYASFPTGLIVEKGTLQGVIVGNKSGRQILLANLVVDATNTALLARLADAQFESDSEGDYRFTRVLIFGDVGPLSHTALRLPAALGIAGNEAFTHPGYGSNGDVLVECPMVLQMGGMNLEGMMQREIEARHRTMHVASYLIQNVEAFKNGKLGVCAYELDGPQTTRLAGPVPDWVAGIKPRALIFDDKNQNHVRVPLEGFAGPLKGLWCLGDAARQEEHVRDLLHDPVNATLAGKAFSQALLSEIGNRKIVIQASGYELDYPLPHRLRVKEQDSPQQGRAYERLIAPPMKVPVYREADVLVVGGGTCGATCANSAGREGAKTVCLELNPGLGGTGTIGSVYSYYFGRYWAGFALRNTHLVDEIQKTINWPSSANPLDGYWNKSDRRAHGLTSVHTSDIRWNIEAKMYALLKDSQRSGVEVFFNAAAFATVMRDDKVSGAVAGTPYGPIAVLSKVTVDTTGDGDVAAFAGARFNYAAVRRHYPMWCLLGQFLSPYSRHLDFENQVEVSNIDDYTRAILVGRRMGPRCYDHGAYLATRESRHIIGDLTVTLTDMLRQREFADVINLGAGALDMHGITASDWCRMGVEPPILPTEMPYGALLPQGLENIVVGGKAYSGTHDSLYNLRNQPEMENLGGSVGVAVAYAVHDGVSPRKVDLPKVQRRLTKVGTLLPEMLTRKINEESYDENAIRNFIKQLDGRPFSSWFMVSLAREGTPDFRKKIPIVEICSADPAVAVPVLKEELPKAQGTRQVQLAQALAMFGSRDSVPVLIETIEQSIRNKIIPPWQPPPPHYVDDICFPFAPATWVYSLGMTRDPRAITVWEKVADLVRADPADFADELPWPFHYVDSICYGAMLLGNPAAAPILTKIHNHPTLRNQSIKKDILADVDFSLDRRAITELTLGRALASLGVAEGYETLIEYLDDNRTNLAAFANLTLAALSGLDNGKDPKAWRAWLSEAQGSLKPIPRLSREDG